MTAIENRRYRIEWSLAGAEATVSYAQAHCEEAAWKGLLAIYPQAEVIDITEVQS